MSEFNITFQTDQHFNATLADDPEMSMDLGTVYLPQAPAVLYEPQDLDDEQQDQARENIAPPRIKPPGMRNMTSLKAAFLHRIYRKLSRILLISRMPLCPEMLR